MRLKPFPFKAFSLFFALLVLTPLPALPDGGPNLPAPPQVFLDTTYVPPTGNSIAVNAGGDLQHALDQASPGDEVVLQAGATFTGHFTLRQKDSGSGWITIRTSDMADLPGDGQRVNPSYAAAMPKIVTPDENPALVTEPGAQNYRVMGVEIAVAPQVPLNYVLVALGDGNTVAQLPSNIIFDRDYVHGAVLCHCKQGIVLNSVSTAVINSYISEFHAIDQDTQALLGYNGPGPFKIVNNYLEASGENIMFGGAATQIPNLVPSDIEFRHNYFAKPIRWRSSIIPKPQGISATAGSSGSLTSGTTYYYVLAASGLGDSGQNLGSDPSAEISVPLAAGQNSVTLTWNPVSYGDSTDSRTAAAYQIYRTSDPPSASSRNWTSYTVTGNPSFTDTGASGGSASPPRRGNVWLVKNLFELKNAQRVLIDGNIFEYCWEQAQSGVAMLLTARITSQQQLWSVVQDVTVTNNLVRHVSVVAVVLGMDDICGPSNLACQQSARILFRNNLMEDISIVNWGGYGWLFQVQHSQDVTIDHNTGFNDRNAVYMHDTNVNLTITNNLMHGDIFGDGSGGTAALAKYTTNAVVTNNVLVKGTASAYGSTGGNFFPASWTAIGFTNYQYGIYTLGANSAYKAAGTDQVDLGADVNAVGKATAGSVTGQIPSQPPAVASVLNAASLAAAPVAPGSIFSLFGANFSALPFTAFLNPLPAGLGDTQVTFNGLPAPLLSVNAGQINAQVPFELPPGPGVAVVTVSGISGAPFAFQIASAAPGLYLTSYGSNYALAVNQDYSANGPAHPAPPGSVLTVYVTGQGPVSPSLNTGAWAPGQPLSQPMQPVSVTVGGQSAQVPFAGLTPFTVGVCQVDVLVPALPAGDYPLVVTVGAAASNAGLISIAPS